MKYEKFHDVMDELISKGRYFDSESLKRLTFGDLMLAGIGNAGEAICMNYEIIEAEEKRRLDAVKDMTPQQVVDDIKKWDRLDDMNMVYAVLRKLADARGGFTVGNAPRWCLLNHYMHALRGNWSGGRNSVYLAKIYELIPEVEEEGAVPLGWVRAVKNNADAFDGKWTDGRVMRDGQLYLDPEVAKAFNLPTTAASGGMAKLIGARAIKQGGYRGSYEELFEEILNPDQMVDSLRTIEGVIDEDD